jgi:hypothetical protein
MGEDGERRAEISRSIEALGSCEVQKQTKLAELLTLLRRSPPVPFDQQTLLYRLLCHTADLDAAVRRERVVNLLSQGIAQTWEQNTQAMGDALLTLLTQLHRESRQLALALFGQLQRYCKTFYQAPADAKVALSEYTHPKLEEAPFLRLFQQQSSNIQPATMAFYLHAAVPGCNFALDEEQVREQMRQMERERSFPVATAKNGHGEFIAAPRRTPQPPAAFAPMTPAPAAPPAHGRPVPAAPQPVFLLGTTYRPSSPADAAAAHLSCFWAVAQLLLHHLHKTPVEDKLRLPMKDELDALYRTMSADLVTTSASPEAILRLAKERLAYDYDASSLPVLKVYNVVMQSSQQSLKLPKHDGPADQLPLLRVQGSAAGPDLDLYFPLWSL